MNILKIIDNEKIRISFLIDPSEIYTPCLEFSTKIKTKPGVAGPKYKYAITLILFVLSIGVSFKRNY